VRALFLLLVACSVPPPAPLKTKPVVLAEDQYMPMQVALSPDGTLAFFVNSGEVTTRDRDSWTLSRVRTDGNDTPHKIFEGMVANVAADATDVYFIGAEKLSSINTTIRRITHDGRDSDLVAGAADMILGFAIDDTNVYWTENTAGKIQMKPKRGGDTTTLASGQKEPIEIIVDRTHVYWIASDMLFRVPKHGGKTEPLIRTSLARSLLIYQDRIYWFGGSREANRGVLQSSTLTGNDVRDVVELVGVANDFAAASDGIYIVDSEEGALRRVVGHSVATVWDGESNAYIACAKDVLVWTDMNGGKVMRLR
jgi:hypothetical protein